MNWQRMLSSGALALMAGATILDAEERRINVALHSTTGEKAAGPATIVLTHVNVVRYDVEVGVGIEYKDPPDLRLPFIPSIPKLDKPDIDTGAGTLGLSASVESLLAALVGLEADRVADVETPIATLIETANRVNERVRALVGASDAVLKTAGPARLAADVQGLQPELDSALVPHWPVGPIGEQLAMLAAIRTRLAGIAVSELDADRKRTYDFITARVSTLDQWYAMVGVESDAAVRARTAQGRLAEWRLIFAAASREEAFTIQPIEVGCGFTFTGTKESKVELVRRDRLAAAGAAPARQEVLTVVCSSPLSVSGGFGFSTVDRDIPAFVSTPETTMVDGVPATTAVTRFGYSERSGYSGFPMLLVNVRLQEWNERLSGHFSFGAGVDMSGKVGISVEYLTGFSLGLHRGVFLTAGWHFAHRHVLAGGIDPHPRFQEGELVPSGLAEPPLEKQRAGGPMLAVTVKLR